MAEEKVVDQAPPSKEEITKFLQEQIEMKKTQLELQELNTKLAVARAEELKAIQFIAQMTNPQPPADAVPYTLTQEDIDADPSIAEQGFKAGDEVLVPKESEPAKRKLKKFDEGGYSTVDPDNPVPSIDEDTRSRAMKYVEGASEASRDIGEPVTRSASKTSSKISQTVSPKTSNAESADEYKERMEGLTKKQIGRAHV